jgi:valyl-tRNA synthetase
MSFGTGALKVTPAHDPNDFEIGKRHDLPSVKVIADDGVMTEEAGRFEGMDRFECRKAVVEALRSEGLLEKIEPHRHSVGHCYRCKTVVEPNLSRQWFVKAKPLAEKAIEAVETGKTRIIPIVEKTYYDWMYNIRDWCISRQIWWGHQIPAWTCQGCAKNDGGHGSARTACPACGKAATWSRNRCAGHLVQFGPVALFHHGLAGADPAAERPSTPHPCWSPVSTFSFSGWPA